MLDFSRFPPLPPFFFFDSTQEEREGEGERRRGREVTSKVQWSRRKARTQKVLLTQQFKLRCQQPNCWKRENPEASAPPLPLKSSIPTKIASLGYITALSFLLLTSKTFFLYCLDANCAGFVLFSLQLFSLFFFPHSPPSLKVLEKLS